MRSLASLALPRIPAPILLVKYRTLAKMMSQWPSPQTHCALQTLLASSVVKKGIFNSIAHMHHELLLHLLATLPLLLKRQNMMKMGPLGRCRSLRGYVTHCASLAGVCWNSAGRTIELATMVTVSLPLFR